VLNWVVYLVFDPLSFDPFVLAFNWKELVLRLDLSIPHRKMMDWLPLSARSVVVRACHLPSLSKMLTLRTMVFEVIIFKRWSLLIGK